jgi:DNA-directed RNA polymerase subunit RPC12/RpoP
MAQPDDRLVVRVEWFEPCSKCDREAMVYKKGEQTYLACPACGHIELLKVTTHVEWVSR